MTAPLTHYRVPILYKWETLGPRWTSLWIRDGTSDEAVLNEVLIEDTYRMRGMEIPPSTTDRRPRIVDVGACTGILSAVAARTYPHCEIIAVEPEQTNFALLEKNVATFGNRVQCVRAAVGHAFGTTSLVGGEGTGHTAWDSDEGQKVDMIPLDHLIGDGCAWLKVDCEGSEYALIDACPSAALARVDRISMEFHGTREAPWLVDAPAKYGAMVSKMAFTHSVTAFGSPDAGGMLFAHRSR